MVMVGCRLFTETRMDSKSIKTGTPKNKFDSWDETGNNK
jgi:hypothetical protein